MTKPVIFVWIIGILFGLIFLNFIISWTLSGELVWTTSIDTKPYHYTREYPPPHWNK